MVRHGDGLVRAADLAAGHAQPLEGLRAGHFMDQMAVDIQQAGAVFLTVDHMRVEDLVVKGAGRARVGLAGHGFLFPKE
jgi:hypothetical protein